MANREVFVVKQPAINTPRVSGVRFLSRPNMVHGVLQESRKATEWKRATWLALDEPSADMLLDEVREQKPRDFGRLAMLQHVTPSRAALAKSYFTKVITESGLEWLPTNQVIRILQSEDAADRIITGMVDKDAGNLLVYRGDLQPIIAPLESFNSRLNVKPDFDDFEIIDWGHTLRFGKFEASADSVLYENDADYRRRLRNRRQANEKTFGASLRRLRLQRELRQSDFPPLTAKTIARIESNEVGQPHGATLNRIASVLHVAPGEIATY